MEIYLLPFDPCMLLNVIFLSTTFEFSPLPLIDTLAVNPFSFTEFWYKFTFATPDASVYLTIYVTVPPLFTEDILGPISEILGATVSFDPILKELLYVVAEYADPSPSFAIAAPDRIST